ncbi:hypothetical protein IGI04_035192 [Brassica rapa subsp. trilocularis]|uniref:Uncharacterized protein n=1 Tax=Brassica rapa subsp. trilocularis TaxID=1813537 RepID=A0ABQ7LAX1_BRACM|nr:hypothetical protein IGI04_035192 [Brassica rapa subsp. trilocularis]
MTMATSSRQFPPPTRASPLSSSFVSVLSLLLLAYISSLMYYSEPADRTTHQSLSLWHRLSSTDALGQIL